MGTAGKGVVRAVGSLTCIPSEGQVNFRFWPQARKPQLHMSSFTFDFDLEDDLDETFDVTPPQKPTTASSIDKTIASECAPGGAMPAEEIPLSTLVRDRVTFK